MNGDGVDICGIVLYLLFFLLVTVRISPFFSDDRLSSTDRIKLAFHCTLLGYSLLEIVHYAIALAYHESALSGYACHLVALWLSLVAFSLVIVLWSTTLHPPRAVGTGVSTASTQRSGCFGCCGVRLSATTKFVVVIDTVVAATTVAVLWTGTVPVHSRTYLILVVAHSVTLFLLASWLVLYGVRLQRRVMNHPRWEPLDRRQRLKILCRINGVLVVCAACFLIRVAVLSSALFSRLWHRAEEMDRLSFELLAKWVSGLVPGVALLHIMCKTKKPGDDSGARQHVSRMNAMQEDQSLKEPLLASREGTGGNIGLSREEEGLGRSARNNRGVVPSSKNGRAGHTTGSRGMNDAFVYNVVRSQGTRTDTTI